MSGHFLSRAFEELFNEDGLCVMARGCGVNKLLAKFVQYYSHGTAESHASQEETKKLVFVLNLAGQEQVILDHLLADGIPPHRLPRVITSENVTAQERAELFRRGGCYIITSRILVVDLLDKKLPAQSILGMLVANAHKITETSLETFILRVYRESHRGGFVKAFSEDPESITGAFAKIDRTMRMLWLQKLYLWPRFHESIVGALDQCQPEVIEIQQPLSNSMKTVQSALLVALSTAINELKRAAPTLDTAYMTLDNGLGVGFDYMVRNQLEPEWHRLSARTRQLVADLRSLRGLLEYLIRYDSLTFYYHLLRLRADSIARDSFSPSLWLSSDAAEIVFRCSKDRVYAVEELADKDKDKKRSASSSSSSSSSAATADAADATEALAAAFDLKHQMVCTMECPPKWTLLLDTVLPEIRLAYEKRKTELASCRTARRAFKSRASSVEEEEVNDEEEEEEEEELNGRVLLLFKDEDTRIRVKDSLVQGVRKILEDRYAWFVAQSAAEIKAKVLSTKGSGAGMGVGGKGDYSRYQQNNSSRTSAFEPAVMAMSSAAKGRDEFLKTDPSKGSKSEQDAANGNTSHVSSTGFTSQQLASLGVESRMMLMEDSVLTRQRTQAALAAQGALEESSTFASQQPKRQRRLQKDKEKGKERQSKSAKARSSSTPGAADSLTDDAAVAMAGEQSDGSEDSEDSEDSEAFTGYSIHEELHIHLLTHQQAADRADVLNEIDPFAVVLYDPDVSMVRRIEVFQAQKEQGHTESTHRARQQHKDYDDRRQSGLFASRQRTTVYFLMYKNSCEEHRYVSALAREKKAFESLVISKGKMAVCLPDLPREILALRTEDHTYSVDSRTVNRGVHAENASAAALNKRVVIDVREFRCPLPSLLHSAGMQIVARSISVGDYVLAPEVCVERKSVSDLIGSFQSGRLYTQAEAMSRHYQVPCLLIEFTEQQSFSFHSPGELSDDIKNDSIQARLVTLALAFPGLRYLWSRGVHSTPEIFRAVMAGYGPVDEEKAIIAGSAQTSGGGASTAGVDEQEARSASYEILLTLPGINVHNVRAVMDGVESLADLACRSEVDMAPLIGSANAKALVTFMNQRSI